MFDKTCTHTHKLISYILLWYCLMCFLGRSADNAIWQRNLQWKFEPYCKLSEILVACERHFWRLFCKKICSRIMLVKQSYEPFSFFSNLPLPLVNGYYKPSIHHMGGLWHCFPNISSIYCYVGRWSSYGQRSCAKTPALSLRDSLDVLNPILIQNPYIYNIKWFLKK